jgi:DNA-binding NarL/FixJ family response regulator
MSMEQLRVLIIDDHPIISEGLPALLKCYPDIMVVGVASDGEEGLAQIRQLKPECVIIDLTLPKMGGIEAIRLYLHEIPELGIVVYTGHKEEGLVCQALQAGARAYVFKGAPVASLVSAIREVHRGGYWLSRELTPSILRRYLSQHGREIEEFAEYHNLSPREKQVFMLLAKGKSPREVSEALFISTKTVSKHQSAIKEKLKVKNVAEMAIYAMRIGLGSTCDA